MKLVFQAGVDGRLPFNILGKPNVPINWSTLHWVPTDEDYSLGSRLLGAIGFRYYGEPKWIPALYTEFASLCLPEGGAAYLFVSPSWGIEGFRDLRKRLDTVGLRSFQLSKETLIAELQREHIAIVFEDNSWQISSHFILTAKNPVPDWPERLKETYISRGFNFELLNELEAIVCNYHEHGIEATSTVLNTETLREIAKRVSDKLNVPIETKETELGSRGQGSDRVRDSPLRG